MKSIVLAIIAISLIGVAKCQDFEAVDEGSKDAENGGNADVPKDDQDDEEEADSQEKQNMTEVMNDIKKTDLVDFAAVSRDALIGAWAVNFKNQTDEVPVLSLLDSIRLTGGEERLTGLRLLELMDSNMDGKITKDEFANLYTPAISTLDQAMGLMFRVYDYDLDGYTNIYEALQTNLMLEGVNQNIFDKWTAAKFDIADKDVDEDGKVSMYEYILYMTVELNYGLAELKPPPSAAAAGQTV